MTKNSKKGFTLVELSIVLVIIGLLIGGILVAQSMIGTARIQAFVRQIGQFDAAIANYQTKFNGLPGDETSVSPDGNNDGLIQSATANTMDGERGEFWNNLSTSGLKNENGQAYAADDGAPGTGVPVAKLGSGIGVWPGADTAARVNYYRIATQPATPNTLTDLATANVNANDSLAIDLKMDNGLATTGNMLVVTDLTADAGGYTTGAYGAANQFAIRFGTSSGMQ